MLSGTQGGKALPIDTPIPTPNGFIEIGKLHMGDFVFGIDGKTRVSYKSPVFLGNKCYRVSFDDGSSLVADEEHLWTVINRNGRKNQARAGKDFHITITTKELKDRIKERWSIDLPQPVEYREAILPIPPYVLGVWLGDGSSRCSQFTNTEAEIVERVSNEWLSVKEIKHKSRSPTYSLSSAKGNNSIFARILQQLGIWGNKRIPRVYLQADVAQRFALLQGLMDTDGYCAVDGGCEFTTIRKGLAEDVLELLRSLGIKARCREGKAMLNGRYISPKYRVFIKTDKPVFSLKRKSERLLEVRDNSELNKLFIQSVDEVESVPTICIKVESPDGMYLAGTSYIPTHNTALGPHWLLREIERRGPGDYIAATATYPLMEKKMMSEIDLVFTHIFNLGQLNAAKKIYTFSENANDPEKRTRIFLLSADNPESAEAATAKAAWMDEAGQLQFRRDAYEAIRRRVAIHEGRIFITTTLYSYGWLKSEIYDKGLAGDPDIDIIQFDSTENPAFPKKEYAWAKRSMPDWKFNMFYRGRFAKPAGMVYDSFNEDVCKIKRFKIEPSWPRYMGVDFGSNNTAALWYARCPLDTEINGTKFKNGDFILYREYLRGGAAASGHVRMFKELSQGENLVRTYGGAGNEDQWRREFGIAGWNIAEPSIAKPDVGISRVYALHKQNKIYIFSDIKGYLDEKMAYSYKVDDDDNFKVLPDIEAKEKFHRMDAERYCLSSFYPTEVGETRPFIMASLSYRRADERPTRPFGF